MQIEKYATTQQKEMDELKQLLINKNNEKKELEMVMKSIEDSMVSKVRSMFIPWTGAKLEEAWRQQNEKLKKDRPVYEGIKGNFQAWIFEPDDRKKVKLEKIMPFNYGHTRYSFIFAFLYILYKYRHKTLTFPSTSL